MFLVYGGYSFSSFVLLAQSAVFIFLAYQRKIVLRFIEQNQVVTHLVCLDGMIDVSTHDAVE